MCWGCAPRPRWPLARRAVDPAAVGLSAGAKNPMIMVGSGARHAAAEVRAPAERLQVPVVPFRSRRGIGASPWKYLMPKSDRS